MLKNGLAKSTSEHRTIAVFKKLWKVGGLFCLGLFIFMGTANTASAEGMLGLSINSCSNASTGGVFYEYDETDPNKTPLQYPTANVPSLANLYDINFLENDGSGPYPYRYTIGGKYYVELRANLNGVGLYGTGNYTSPSPLNINYNLSYNSTVTIEVRVSTIDYTYDPFTTEPCVTPPQGDPPPPVPPSVEIWSISGTQMDGVATKGTRDNFSVFYQIGTDQGAWTPMSMTPSGMTGSYDWTQNFNPPLSSTQNTTVYVLAQSEYCGVSPCEYLNNITDITYYPPINSHLKLNIATCSATGVTGTVHHDEPPGTSGDIVMDYYIGVGPTYNYYPYGAVSKTATSTPGLYNWAITPPNLLPYEDYSLRISYSDAFTGIQFTGCPLLQPVTVSNLHLVLTPETYFQPNNVLRPDNRYAENGWWRYTYSFVSSVPNSPDYNNYFYDSNSTRTMNDYNNSYTISGQNYTTYISTTDCRVDKKFDLLHGLEPKGTINYTKKCPNRPYEPTNVLMGYDSSSPNNMHFTWTDNANNEEGNKINLCSDITGDCWDFVSGPTTSYYGAFTCIEGDLYSAKMRAFNNYTYNATTQTFGYGESDWSQPVYFAPASCTNAIPVDTPSVITNTPQEVKLRVNVSTYSQQIKRYNSTYGDVMLGAGTLDPGGLTKSFVDTSAVPGRTYEYEHQITKDGTTYKSTRVSVTIPNVATPTGFSVRQEGNNFKFSWNIVNYADSYDIYYKVNGGTSNFYKSLTGSLNTDTWSNFPIGWYDQNLEFSLQAKYKGALSTPSLITKTVMGEVAINTKTRTQTAFNVSWSRIDDEDSYQWTLFRRKTDGTGATSLSSGSTTSRSYSYTIPVADRADKQFLLYVTAYEGTNFSPTADTGWIDPPPAGQMDINEPLLFNMPVAPATTTYRDIVFSWPSHPMASYYRVNADYGGTPEIYPDITSLFVRVYVPSYAYNKNITATVTALDASGNVIAGTTSASSAPVSTTIPTPALSKTLAAKTVTLNWSGPNLGTNYFDTVISRKFALTGNITVYAPLEPSVLTGNQTLTEGKYIYDVTSTNSLTNSTASTTQDVVIPLNAPTGLTLSLLQYNPIKIRMTWTDNSSWETGYKIVAGAGTGSPSITQVGPNVTTVDVVSPYACGSDPETFGVYAYNSDSALLNSTVLWNNKAVPCNAKPTATPLGLTGPAIVGSTITASYVYHDNDGDLMSDVRIFWFPSNDGENPSGYPYKADIKTDGSPADFVIPPGTAGKYILINVYPFAQTGWLQGTMAPKSIGPIADNKVPTASSISIIGIKKVLNQLEGGFNYSDFENDPQGTHIYEWWIGDGSAAPGGVTTMVKSGTISSDDIPTSYTPALNMGGKYVYLMIQPKATSGGSPGLRTWSNPYGVIAPNVPPFASVKLEGIAKVGNTLIGSYDYTDTENDPEGNSIYEWFRSSNFHCLSGDSLANEGNDAYVIQPDDNGYYIYFQVTPVATSGTSPGSPASACAGPVSLNAPPVASSLTIIGNLKHAATLTGNYSYSDAEQDLEYGSTFRWLRANDASGTGKEEILGATAITYTLVTADDNKYIYFEVTPRADDGTTPGAAVQVRTTGPIDPNHPPVASGVNITYPNLKRGVTLTGHYTYSDDEGDAQATSTFKWYRAEDDEAVELRLIDGATAPTYTTTASDDNKYIYFEVTPKATTPVDAPLSLTGNAVISLAVGKIIPNYAPEVVYGSITISGTKKVDNTLTGLFTYYDEEDNPQGNHKYEWWSGNGAVGPGGASTKLKEGYIPSDKTEMSVPLSLAEGSKYIYLMIQPMATAGTITGARTWSLPYGIILPNYPPSAVVQLSGNEIVGSTLTGSYTYADAEGNAEGSTLIKWYRSDFEDGTGKEDLNNDGNFTYNIDFSDLGKFIFFEVTPLATYGGSPGSTASVYVGPVVANEPPEARSLTLSYDVLKRGHPITGDYTFYDLEGDNQGVTTFKWYRSDYPSEANKVVIPGATSKTYTPTISDDNKYLYFEVTPVATTPVGVPSSLIGAPVQIRTLNKIEPNLAPFVLGGSAGITISGTKKVDNTLAGIFAYSDTESDPQGSHIYEWWSGDGSTAISLLSNGIMTNASTPVSLSLSLAEGSKYIYLMIQPISTAGNMTGERTWSLSYGIIEPNYAPTASVSLDGNALTYALLTGSYHYSDAEGDTEGGTQIKWYRANNAQGTGWTDLNNNNNSTYTVRSWQTGMYIFYVVTPYATYGGSPGNPVVAYVGPVSDNAPPVAKDVNITGTLKRYHTLTGHYTYYDNETNLEGSTTFKWFRADYPTEDNKEEIIGANSITYTLVKADDNKYVYFEVTPVATTGTSPGVPVQARTDTYIEEDFAPTVPIINLTGDLKRGHLLTGSYTYADVEGDLQDIPNTLIKWYRANDASGNGKVDLFNNGSSTYTTVSADDDKYIFFEVTPAALSGETPGLTYRTYVGPIIPNQAPFVLGGSNGIAISGNKKVDNTLTGIFAYSDTESDPQGSHIYEWWSGNGSTAISLLLNGTMTNASTPISLPLTLAEGSKYIYLMIQPIATAGTMTGVRTWSLPYGIIEPNYPPTASVNLTGEKIVGFTLTGSYTYADVEGDTQGATTKKWYKANNPSGTGRTHIENDGNLTYTVQLSDVDMYIFFEVIPYATYGGSPGNPVFKSIGPILDNTPPEARTLTLSYDVLKRDHVITGDYTYFDFEGDSEGVTTFKWYRSDYPSEANKEEIFGATSKGYTPTSSDDDKYLYFEVTPVATTPVGSPGSLTGTPVQIRTLNKIEPNYAPFVITDSMNITGDFRRGHELTGTYAYSDTEGDLQDVPNTIIKWYRSDDINGSNKVVISSGSLTYTSVLEDENKYIVFEITPVALTPVGIVKSLIGVPFQKVIGPIIANEKPRVTLISLSGLLKRGHPLTGAYAYSDTEDDAQGVSLLRWYRADNSLGANKTLIDSNNQLSGYTSSSIDDNKYIYFEVTPVATWGASPGITASTKVGPIEPNKAPEALNLVISGELKRGHTLTGTYDYYDYENDSQGSTVLEWFRADNSYELNITPIGVVGSSTYTLTKDDDNKYIYFKVTPKATWGEPVGLTKSVNDGPVLANLAPTTSNVRIIYSTPINLGGTVSGSYVYLDYENDPQGASIYKWYRANDASGFNSSLIDGENSIDYVLKSADIGRFLFFEVIPVALTGEETGIAYRSGGIGPVLDLLPPVANFVDFTGIFKMNMVMTGTYTFFDINGDSESGTTFQWYRSDDEFGLNRTVISGATATTYTTQVADVNKYLSFEVTPRSDNEPKVGLPVESLLKGPVINTPPTLTSLTPLADVSVFNSYLIQWQDEDPDDNASISLYLDTDNIPLNGGEISVATGIEEDSDGEFDQYTVDLLPVATGDYYVYAVIYDHVNQSVGVYSSGVLTIYNNCDGITKTCPIPLGSQSNWINDVALEASFRGVNEDSFYTMVFDAGSYSLEAPLNIGSKVSVSGKGRRKTFLNGNNTNRIFNFYNNDGNVSMLSIQNGREVNGGAVYLNDSSTTKFESVTFTSNIASNKGGVVYSKRSNPEFSNVIIYANTATNEGSVLYNEGNDALGMGNAKFTNCTIVSNTSTTNKSFIYNDLGASANTGVFDIRNSIILNNGLFSNADRSRIFYTYSNIDYSAFGSNNIQESPVLNQLFRDTASLDLSLKKGTKPIDNGDPNMIYNDPDDPNRVGFALPYAWGSVRNDMGAYGGPLTERPFEANRLGPDNRMDGSNYNTTDVTLYFVITDDDTTDVMKYEVQLSKNSNSFDSPITQVLTNKIQGTQEVTFTGLSSGAYYWRVNVTDSNDNVSTWTNATIDTPAFIIDQTIPTVTILTNQNTDEFKYLSIKGNDRNDLEVTISEPATYIVEGKNLLTDLVVVSLENAAGGSPYQISATTTWNGETGIFYTSMSSYQNSTSGSYGTFIPQNGLEFKTLLPNEKEFIPYFNLDSQSESVLNFDKSKNQYLSTSSGTQFHFTNSGISIGAWIYPRPTASGVLPIVSEEDGSQTKNYSLYVQSPGDSNLNNLVFSFNNDTIKCSTPANSLPRDRWSYVAVSYNFGSLNNSDGKIYVNDDEYPCNPPAGDTAPLYGSNLLIGRSVLDGGSYFDGYIANLAIANKKKTTEEIMMDMNLRLSGAEPGLVAYYNFHQSKITADGYYRWTVVAKDRAGNYSLPTISNTFIVDNTPPRISNVTLSYNVEGYFKRNLAGEVLRVNQLDPNSEPLLFTDKIVSETFPGSNSYQVSRDILSSPEIKVVFEADGLVDYDVAEIIPYIGALGPAYPNTTDMVYNKLNPVKTIDHVGLNTNSNASDMQIQHMTIHLRDKAKNESTKSFEVTNELPVVKVNRDVDVIAAGPPVYVKEASDNTLKSCDKTGQAPYCPMVNATLVVSNVADKSKTLLHSKSELEESTLDGNNTDLEGPEIILNYKKGDELSNMTINPKKDIPYYFESVGTNDASGIFQSYYEFKKDGLVIQTAFDTKSSFVFDSTTANYEILFRATDNIGNQTEIIIPDSRITVKTTDVENPKPYFGENLTWVRGVPYIFDATGSTDDIQINPKKYFWDFNANDDISFTSPDSIGRRAVYTFNTTGVYKVTLQVSDTSDKTAQKDILVNVLDEGQVSDQVFSPVTGFVDLDNAFFLTGLDLTEKNSYAKINLEKLAENSQGTIEFWVNPSEIIPAPSYRSILALYESVNPTSNQVRIGIDSNNKLVFDVYRESAQYISGKSKDPLMINGSDYTHFALTFGMEGSLHKNRIYINGEEIEMDFSVGNEEFQIYYDDLKITIGFVGALLESGGLTSSLQGKFDELRFFDKKLTPTEVNTTMTKGIISFKNDIIYNYSFDNYQTFDSTKSLYFEGSVSKGEAKEHAKLNISSGDFSIGAWIKIPEGASGDLPILSKQKTIDSGNYSLFVDATNKALKFSFLGTSGTTNTCQSGSNLIVNNSWHNVVLNHTFGNGSDTEFFIDGNKSVCNWMSGSGNDSPDMGHELNLAMYKNGLNSFSFYKGFLDTITIFRERRNTYDIQKDMRGEISGTEKNLMAYYRFEEGIGNKVINEKDSSYGEIILSNPNWTDDFPSAKSENDDGILKEKQTSLKFNANSYLQVASSLSNYGTDNITFEFSAKANNVAKSFEFFRKRNTRDSGNGFIFYYDNSRKSLIFEAEDYGEQTINLEVNDISKIFNNSWHNFAVTIDRNLKRVSLFIDSNLEKEINFDSINLGSLDSIDDLYFGQGFWGEMSEIRIYDYAKFERDIELGRFRRISLSDPEYNHLLLYLRLDEGQTVGSKVFDSSSYFNSVVSVNTIYTSDTDDISPLFEPQRKGWWNLTDSEKNYSAMFKGDSFITLTSGYDKFISGKENFAIELNAYIDSLRSSQYLISDHDNKFYVKVNDDRSIEIKLKDGVVVTTEKDKMPIKKWANLSLSFDTDVLDLYIDGLPIGSFSDLEPPEVVAGDDLLIGTDSTNSYYLYGYLSELRFWKTSRSLSDILELAMQRVPKSYTGYGNLNGYYSLDDYGREGGFIYDYSDNEFNTIGTSTNIGFSENMPVITDSQQMDRGETNHKTSIVLLDNMFVTATDANAFDSDKTNFTFEAFIKSSNIPAKRTIVQKIEDKSGALYGYNFYLDETNRLVLQLYDGALSKTITSRKIINDEKWHHVAFTVDYAYLKSYVFLDGITQNPKDYLISSLNTMTNNSLLKIGRYTEADPRQFIGQIDQIRISNEIRYQGDFYPRSDYDNDSNTIGLYDFNDGKGPVAPDKSQYDNDLELSDEIMWRSLPDKDLAPFFSGNSKLYLPAGSLGITDQSFTLEFYAKVNNASGSLFNFGQDLVSNEGIRIKYIGDNVYLSLKPNNGQSLLPANEIVINYPVNDNIWHHFALSVDREDKLYFFIDGIKKYQTDISSITQNFLLSSYNAILGANNAGNYMIGSMDQIRVSSVARYNANFEVPTNYIPDYSTLAFYSFNSVTDNEALVNNDIGIAGMKLTPQNITYKTLGETAYIYGGKALTDEVGSYVRVDKDDEYKIKGIIESPSFGSMYFDKIPDGLGGFNENISTPKVLDYMDKKSKNKDRNIFEINGSYFSSDLGFFGMSYDGGNVNFDNRTGQITGGGSFNPVVGFTSFAGARINALDLEAPLISIDPLYKTFVSQDTNSITINGSTTDRFGSGTEAVYFKLNDSGFKLCDDDSLDSSFKVFHASIKGLKSGENIITFKTLDRNGNSNDRALSISVYRSYTLNYNFFSPAKVTKISFRGDATKGDGRVPEEIKVELSNNEEFISDPSATPPKYAWNILNIKGNRSADNHVYEIADFDRNSGYTGLLPEHKQITYARLVVEDTVGHEAPYLDGKDGFKVYTDVDNILIDPWTLSDVMPSSSGMRVYYNPSDPDTIPNLRTEGNRETGYFVTEPNLDKNTITNTDNIKFLFTGSNREDRDGSNQSIETTIKSGESIAIDFMVVSTKNYDR